MTIILRNKYQVFYEIHKILKPLCNYSIISIKLSVTIKYNFSDKKNTVKVLTQYTTPEYHVFVGFPNNSENMESVSYTEGSYCITEIFAKNGQLMHH